MRIVSFIIIPRKKVYIREYYCVNIIQYITNYKLLTPRQKSEFVCSSNILFCVLFVCKIK